MENWTSRQISKLPEPQSSSHRWKIYGAQKCPHSVMSEEAGSSGLMGCRCFDHSLPEPPPRHKQPHTLPFMLPNYWDPRQSSLGISNVEIRDFLFGSVWQGLNIGSPHIQETTVENAWQVCLFGLLPSETLCQKHHESTALNHRKDTGMSAYQKRDRLWDSIFYFIALLA